MVTPNEPRKSIWKKPWKSRTLFISVVTVATSVIVWVIGSMVGMGKEDTKVLASIIAVLAVAAITVVFIVSSIRWLCCWRNLRKALFGLAVMMTLVALFYAEED